MPANTTRDEDRIISRADEAPTMEELTAIIRRLDDELTIALEKIEELEIQLKETANE